MRLTRQKIKRLLPRWPVFVWEIIVVYSVAAVAVIAALAR